MAARLLLYRAQLPRSNSHEMAKLSDRLTQEVWDPSNSEALLNRAADLVNKVAHGNFHRDEIRTQPFTENVKAACAGG